MPAGGRGVGGGVIACRVPKHTCRADQAARVMLKKALPEAEQLSRFQRSLHMQTPHVEESLA